MRAHLVLLMVLVAGASADEDGGILETINKGISKAGAAIGSLYTAYETAPYTVQNTVMDNSSVTVLYEQRMYPAQNWVCTAEVEDEEDEASRNAFMRLFAYITGANEGSHKIPMTTPVSMMRVPLTEAELASQSQEDQGMEASEEEDDESEEESEEVQSKYTMCFYINSANQENTPVPSNPEVFIENRPAMTVLANRDGGFMSENDWEVQADKLKEDSMASGEAGVDYSKYYRAGYDSPIKFWNRRNEIWYMKQV